MKMSGADERLWTFSSPGLCGCGKDIVGFELLRMQRLLVKPALLPLNAQRAANSRLGETTPNQLLAGSGRIRHHASEPVQSTVGGRMAIKYNYEGDLFRSAKCDNCGTEYHYFHPIELKASDEAKLQEKLNKAIKTEVGIVPCSHCGKLNKAMRREWIGQGIALIVGIVLFIGGLFLVIAVADQGSVALVGLAILCLFGLAVTAFNLLLWPIKPWLGKRKGFTLDRLDRVKPAASCLRLTTRRPKLKVPPRPRKQRPSQKVQRLTRSPSILKRRRRSGS